MIRPVTENLDELVAVAADEFLERLRGGETVEVEEYVAQYPQIAGVLRDVLPALCVIREPVFADTAAEEPVENSPPIKGTLGDFEIIREIGRGGMGVVYEAGQISLGRRVALKTLPFASALVSTRLNRFRNEAQAAARLHHSHIVPVYAVGTERGVWYYAMQLIEGHTLAEEIGCRRRTVSVEGRGDETLRLQADETIVRTPREDAVGGFADPEIASPMWHRRCVELCIQAADALEHAHSLDIIHRDIKPGNLMVDMDGHLWVTDFGLARVRDSCGVTATGDIVGTLAYMSPEQACGDNGLTDRRVDIYALGATLYELLTLQAPFEADNRGALLTKITNGEPAPPRRLNPSIPHDLETITLKCLSREPSARYPTAHELAQDLTRFLENRPIQARRPTPSQRVSKWARRHRPLVTVTAAALLLLMVGSVISTAVIATEKARTDRALEDVRQRERHLRFALLGRDRQRDQAQANLRQAENNARQAREVLGYFMDVVGDDMAQTPELRELRQQMLEAGLSYYRDFIRQASGNPEQLHELARGHHHVARILYEMGTTPEACEAIEQAMELQEELVRQNPRDRELRMGLSIMYHEHGTFSGSGLVDLIRDEAVREEIGMGQEQVIVSDEIADEFHRTRYRRSDRSDPTSVRRRFQERLARATDRIRELLSTDQFRRLRQIELQVRGPKVWYDRTVCDAIALTEEQRRRIRELDRHTWRSLRRKGRRERARILAETGQRIRGLLTDRQRARWAEMTGPEFKRRG